MKYLPIGYSDFPKIVRENRLYVDKTEYIYKLIKEGSIYFLSRPRRFGKSLLVSILNEIFKGNKELFRGLYIYDTDYDWEEYPVVRISFGVRDFRKDGSLEELINYSISYIGKKYGVDIEGNFSYEGRLQRLIRTLSEKYDRPVVILIDEYDKPILDVIDNIDLAKDHRDTLKAFYTIIKEEDAHIRFVLLTGVSKFSKTGVFSGLNNLEDITMNPDYSSMLGITEEEVGDYFSSYIERLKERVDMGYDEVMYQIKRWYDGYCFSERCKRVYNPFSLLLLFKNRIFSNYWFETGTPTFLIKLIKSTPDFNLSDYIGKYFPEYTFSQYDIEDLKPFPILFQTGYLTIKDVYINRDTMEREYKIDFPNFEVKNAFLNVLLMSLSPSVKNTGGKAYIDRLLLSLRGDMEKRGEKEIPDFDTFFDTLSIFFADIPYDIQIKREIYYETIFYTVFLLLGLRIETEVKTNRGRIDVIIKDDKRSNLFIFEFKLIDNSSNIAPDDAIKQIIDKGYEEKYRDKYRDIYLIGVIFDMEKRNIGGWRVVKG